MSERERETIGANETKKRVYNYYLISILIYDINPHMMDNFIADEEETWSKRDVVLQKDVEKTMNRTCINKEVLRTTETKRTT